MTDRLKTSAIHRILTSPVAYLYDTRWMESFSIRMLGAEYVARRARAAASITHGHPLTTFLEELGCPDIPYRVRPRLERALEAYREIEKEAAAIDARWEKSFWGQETPANLVDLEVSRRRAAHRRVRPLKLFGFLARLPSVSPVKWTVPSPAEVREKFADALSDPGSLYAAPGNVPAFECSRRVLGPAGNEYFVRFPSPSEITGDTVYGRVYEPERAEEPVPTVIFCGGMGEMYDQLTYWPAEEYAGRTFSAMGFRVILPEAPWHGRRELPGWYSAEPYLATAPVGFFQLFSAHAREISALIRWARERGAPVVAVGGFSMGSIVAAHVAGWCASWPPEARPDVAILGGFSNHMDRLLMENDFTEILGGDKAVTEAGWTTDSLKELRSLFDPPLRPGLKPDRILAFLGSKDNAAPFPLAVEKLREWEIPERNITIWKTGHVGLMLRISRCREFADGVAGLIRSAGGS